MLFTVRAARGTTDRKSAIIRARWAVVTIYSLFAVAIGKMRNAESKMRNQKCGMTLIGRGDKPRDRWLSEDYHTSLSTGSAVKCRPEVRKKQCRQMPLL